MSCCACSGTVFLGQERWRNHRLKVILGELLYALTSQDPRHVRRISPGEIVGVSLVQLVASRLKAQRSSPPKGGPFRRFCSLALPIISSGPVKDHR